MKTDIRTQRARLVKLIHVAKRELGLDEETYRLMLQNVGDAESTMRMELRQLQAVVDHMKTKGFKVRSAGYSRPDRRQDNSHSARKVRALWLFLHQLGAVRDPSERALAAYCKRIAKVDDLHWARHDQLHDLIETLKKWAMRVLPATIEALKEEARQAHQNQPFDAECVAAMQGAVARAKGAGYDAHWSAWSVLTEALGRTVHVDLQAAGAQA